MEKSLQRPKSRKQTSSSSIFQSRCTVSTLCRTLYTHTHIHTHTKGMKLELEAIQTIANHSPQFNKSQMATWMMQMQPLVERCLVFKYIEIDAQSPCMPSRSCGTCVTLTLQLHVKHSQAQIDAHNCGAPGF